MKYNTLGVKIFNFFNIIFLTLVSATCVLPFLHLLAISFSGSTAVASGAVTFWPKEFSTASYEFVLKDGRFMESLLVSIKRLVIGVSLNLFLMIITAYPLSKTKDKLMGRNIYMSYFFLTMLVGGGMIPTYLVVVKAGLKNSLWSLILPGALPVYSMVILMNFMRGIPPELEEAAAIDGANPFQILMSVLLPVLKPALATVSLFCIVGHWNDWFSGVIYIDNPALFPLQTYLQSLLTNFEQMIQQMRGSDFANIIAMMNGRTARAAQLFLGSIPVMLIYPFLQKYFAKGLIMGSVKG